MDDKKQCVVLISTFIVAGTFQVEAVTVPAGVELASVQHLVRGNRAEPSSLDPHKTSGLPESNVLCDLLEGLVNIGSEGNIVPGVAERWESQDMKTWVFHLRRDAKWSNGEPVMAQDFVYSWRRLVDPATASPYASYLQDARLSNVDEIIAGRLSPEALGIQALDARTLQVTLSQPVYHFIKMLPHMSLKPIHAATVEKYKEQWTLASHWVGNGAYQLSAWMVNERIILKRSPTYWDNSNTVINQVTYLPIEPGTNEISRYRAGEIDIIFDTVPMEHFSKLKQELPDELHAFPKLSVYFYEFNTRQAPFDNVKVRQALALAIDRDTIVNRIKAQGDLTAYNFTPSFMESFTTQQPEFATWSQKKRNQMAQDLLHQAGYSQDKPLKFNLLFDSTELNKKLAVAISSMWRQVLNVEVTLENQEWKTFLEMRYSGQHQVARASWSADYNDPSAFLNTLRSNSRSNTTGYHSKQFDQLMDQALVAKDATERLSYYQQAEALLAAEMPVIPIYHFVDARLIKPSVKGYSIHNPMDTIATKDLYMVSGQKSKKPA